MLLSPLTCTQVQIYIIIKQCCQRKGDNVVSYFVIETQQRVTTMHIIAMSE